MKTKSKKFKSSNSSLQERFYPSRNFRKNDYSRTYSRRPHRWQRYGYDFNTEYEYTDHPVKSFPRKYDKNKFLSRPVSPVLGSEEYMKKKIEETSAIIMKQLLNPDQDCFENVKQPNNEDRGECSTINTRTDNETKKSVNNYKSKLKKGTIYNIDEIHNKIMSHITNLNDGKKKNLVNFNMSSYDVIHQIQKQRRLEISRALRAVVSQSKDKIESSNFINSIIPDIGIKIEELPQELIEELSNTLNVDFDWNSDDNQLRNKALFFGSPEQFASNELNGSDTSTFEKSPTEIYVKPEFADPKDCEIDNRTALPYDEGEIESNKIIAPCAIKKEMDYNSFEPIDISSDDDINMDSSASLNIDKNSDQNFSGITIKKEICEQSDVDCSNFETQLTSNYQDQDQSSTSHITQESYHDDKNSKFETESLPTKEQEKEANQNNNCFNKDTESNCVSRADNWTQTKENVAKPHCAETYIDNLLAEVYKQIPKTLVEAVNRMLEIDRCIMKLTNYRQSLFINQRQFDESSFSTVNEEITTNCDPHKRLFKRNNQPVTSLPKKRKKSKSGKRNKNKVKQITIDHNTNDLEPNVINNDTDKNCITSKCLKDVSCNKTEEISEEKDMHQHDKHHLTPILKFPYMHEKVLVIKVMEDKLVVGTESGKIIFFNLENGHHKKILKICDVPITSILYIKQEIPLMYVGSFSPILKIYNFHNHAIVENVPLEDCIQCMEDKWGYIFIGCMKGSLLRYSQKKKVIESEDRISDSSILVLKATQEGARRVLLVGSRNAPVCIRDAISGLYMRTMENIVSPTVYSLILEKSLVYCGTTNHDILVYSFHDGKLIQRHKATDSKGIGCMKIVNNLLFASCHNGKIYVYDIKSNIFISEIQGPGGVILAMEVFENQIVVSTMSFKFVSLPIPENILKHKM